MTAPWCLPVHSVWKRAVDDLREVNGARHEIARDAVYALVMLGGEGHHGVRSAIEDLSRVFATAVGPERVAGGEWHRLLKGAVEAAITRNRAPRQHCEHDAIPGIEAPPGFGMPSPGTAATPVPAGLTLPEQFWAARPVLQRIRQAAHSRVRSGDVVLYSTLCRLAAMAPHTLRADTGVATPASLNLFVAVVGPSGSGKSSGLSVSRELVKSENPPEEFPLGSGEGVAEAFMGMVERPTGEMARDGSAKTKPVREQVRHNALFHADEGAALNKLIERAGSTVGETLRTLWSGETIGQKNGRADTTRTVPAGSYSAGLVIGYQPSTVLPLLADVEAGTPQRFLFCWAEDPSIPPRGRRAPQGDAILSPFPPGTPTSLPAAAVTLGLAGTPMGPVPAPPVHETVVFAQEILDEIYDTEHGKVTGTLPEGHWLLLPGSRELDPYKSQHPVLKVKVSAGLALLEGRRTVLPADWQLAQVVIDTSDRVLAYLRELERTAAGKARAAYLAAEHETEQHRAHARAAVSATLDATAERRVAVRLALRVHENGPMTLGALRKASTSADRKLIEGAVEVAMGMQWVAADGEGRLAPGVSRPTG